MVKVLLNILMEIFLRDIGKMMQFFVIKHRYYIKMVIVFKEVSKLEFESDLENIILEQDK
jgi:hypothetical protein